MMEILSASVQLVNLPFTILLGCVIGYWLLMALGLIDFDTSLDVDVDAGIDVEADADLEVDSDADASPGLFSPVLQFLNIGEVPLMVVLSIMVLSMWTISLAANHYFNDGSLVRALMLLLPNLLVTCIVTRLVTRPLKSLFQALNRNYEEHLPIVGRTCTIATSEANAQFGQAQIDTKGAPLLISVRTSGDAVLRKGETGLVIKEDPEKSIYTIIKVTADKLEV